MCSGILCAPLTLLCTHSDALIAHEVTAIATHINLVRLRPHLSGAAIIVVVEANLDWVRAKEIWLALERVIAETDRESNGIGVAQRRVYPYSFDNASRGNSFKRPGVWVTYDMKEQYVDMMIQFLQYKNIAFLDPFIASAEDVAELRRQLLAFERVVMESKDAFGRPRYTYSGKGKGAKDDRVMSLLMGLYHAVLFFRREETCRAFGLTRRLITGRPNVLRDIATVGREQPMPRATGAPTAPVAISRV